MTFSYGTVTQFPISKLTLLEKNPRKITKDQFAKLCNNISNDPDFLRARPICVNHTNQGFIVYAGNQRVRAAKKLGWKEIPCIIEPEVPEKIQKDRCILDNIHHGEFDWEELGNEFSPLDLLSLGMTEQQLHLDAIDHETNEEGETEAQAKHKKKHTCPDCGCEF